MHEPSPSPANTDASEQSTNRWPHIQRFLRVDSAGGLDDDFLGWSSCVERKLSPVELAAAYEEWADFWEWRLAWWVSELVGDRRRRHLVVRWTDSMVYSCRRSAAWARGEDPGEWVAQVRRRPDLCAESQVIVGEIIAELNPCHRPAERLAVAG